MTVIRTDVCVVGGGPGGRALALALARLGRESVLLEQRHGAARSFYGESVSPQGVRILDSLGVWDELAGRAHRVDRLEIADGGRRVLDVRFADFPYTWRHPVELAQPALLAELSAAALGACRVLEPAAAVGLIEERGRVAGVRARTPEGELEIRAAVTVGADGRFSQVRRMAGLEDGARRTPLERDVIWLKLPFPAGWDRRAYRIRIAGASHALFLPGTDGRVRVGLNIPKGGLRQLRADGVGRLRAQLAALAPELHPAAEEHIRSWSDTVLLDIFTTEVARWSVPGAVLLGDAAHTLTPVLGQGINHALADAVALAGLLAPDPASDAAPRAFECSRRAPVTRSRALQLRQERLFTLAVPPGPTLRRTVYRTLNALPALRRRVFAPVYFPGERPVPADAPRDLVRSAS
ncbi:6-methylpretetramide 4-monooxygenase [Streptomyces sp. RB5]|uniref:6-methylpretetramide 4-monooxygenase n=1 Tax=Streptomyces smaragdinus TaxID=2585196 RepID=A0A7K0CDV6_9ACTN|nr:FAD-dependent monooxygenase [Streptomyces smaragdinus]MQY11658.1 6-methylpretetramide 4-monooxygenase [Streptomyces smaragdinus]